MDLKFILVSDFRINGFKIYIGIIIKQSKFSRTITFRQHLSLKFHTTIQKFTIFQTNKIPRFVSDFPVFFPSHFQEMISANIAPEEKIQIFSRFHIF